LAFVSADKSEQLLRNWRGVANDSHFLCAGDEKCLGYLGGAVLVSGVKRGGEFVELVRRQKQYTSLVKTDVVSDVYAILARAFSIPSALRQC
jgi:hypothetical protein